MKRMMLAAALALAVLPGTANAGQITLSQWNYGYTADFVARGVAHNNIITGSATLTNPTGGLEAYVPQTFEGYCVDLAHNTGTNPYDTPVPPALMSTWNLAVPAQPSAGGSAAAYLYNKYATGAVGDNVKRAALALSIWEVLYDNDFSLSTLGAAGGFQVTSSLNAGVASAAATYLGDVKVANYASSDAGWLKLVDATKTDTQDFIAPVPEPGSMMLLGSGLLGLAGAIRRRIRR